MLDAWLNYKAELHTCGRHLSESMHRVDGKGQQWVGVYDVCDACAAVEKQQKKQSKVDRKREDAGEDVATSARMWRAVTIPEAREMRARQLRELEASGVDTSKLNLKGG